MPDVVPTFRLTETAVMKMLAAGVAKAHEISSPSGIAVLDTGGHLRGWVLMDGATQLAFDAVTKKGKTSAFTGAPSGSVPAEIAARLAAAMPDFANLPGGFPIKHQGDTIGAIAAGGGSHEADAAVAAAALASLDL